MDRKSVKPVKPACALAPKKVLLLEKASMGVVDWYHMQVKTNGPNEVHT